MFRSCFVLSVLLVFSCMAWADEVILTDGSRLVGQVKGMTDEKVVLDTDFSGQLQIDASKVRGISTEQHLTVQLKSGDRVVGNLNYTDGGVQNVGTQAMGPVEFQIGQVKAIWTAGQEGPEVAGLRAELTKAQNPWSARMHLGINGESGNTDRIAVDGRMEIKRVTDADRLLIYTQGRFSRENGEDTVKEILGGLNLEVDVDEKWFLFGRTELEHDKFENLDLRTSVSGGVGYFVVREADEEFKLRAGIGFQHESFDSGDTDDQAVADLGWDYRKEFSPTLLFTHSTTIFPTFEDIGDFRIVMENAIELPLTKDEDWKLRLGVRNNYDAMPDKGVDRLDTYYFLNVVMDWK